MPLLSPSPTCPYEWCFRWAYVPAFLLFLITACALLRPGIAWAEDNGTTLYSEGMTARQNEDWPTAIARFKAALSLKPDDPDILYMLGTSQAFAGHFKDARHSLEQALDLAPNNNDIRLALARASSWGGDHAGALAFTHDALSDRPDNVEAHILKGRLNYYLNRLAAAEDAYTDALNLEAENAEALAGLAEIKKARADKPSPAPPPRPADDFAKLMEAGQQARHAGDWAAAITAFDAALALRPDNVEAAYYLGSTLGFRGDFKTAQRTLEAALEINPTHVDTRLALARVLVWQENFAAAESEATRLLDSDPDNPQALSVLGDIALARGDRARAEDLYARAAALSPNSQSIADKLQRARQRPPRWHLTLGGGLSSFERRPVEDWRDGLFQVGFDITQDSRITGRYEIHRRFDSVDSHIYAGIDHRFAPWLATYAGVAITPNAEFLAEKRIEGGVAIRLLEGSDDGLGPTVFTLDMRRSIYGSGKVDNINPGLQQYLTDYFSITLRQINTLATDGTYTRGALGRADWLINDWLTIYGGYAKAPETDNGVTLNASTYFSGLVADLNERTSTRIDYSRDDREKSYIRHAVGISLSVSY